VLWNGVFDVGGFIIGLLCVVFWVWGIFFGCSGTLGALLRLFWELECTYVWVCAFDVS